MSQILDKIDKTYWLCEVSLKQFRQTTLFFCSKNNWTTPLLLFYSKFFLDPFLLPSHLFLFDLAPKLLTGKNKIQGQATVYSRVETKKSIRVPLVDSSFFVAFNKKCPNSNIKTL